MDTASTSRAKAVNETLTLADRYVMLGLKLKATGELQCMFCSKYARVGSDGVAEVAHHEDCTVVKCYIPRKGGDHGE
jgi:hypothetical protein